MSVTIGRIHGNASLIIDMGTLSCPGALSDGKAITISRISLLEWKRNISDSGISCPGVGIGGVGRLCFPIKDVDSSDTLVPTEVKKLLNSSATSFRSLEYTSWEIILRGIQFLITFHMEFLITFHMELGTAFLKSKLNRVRSQLVTGLCLKSSCV